ncbi:MAG: histidine--tRNA ligase [Acidobacteria bacterium]|nr:histidine--tRNA ligase [Acidobacteriota bacterium]
MTRREPIRAVKGMRDILPPESALWARIEDQARAVFLAYNYQEIRTPIVEPTSLFVRSVGEETDIVGKEMYTWTDRDESSLTLRPEATASVMRAYIEHRLDQRIGVKKYFYMGPMFRRERPQKGRYRQFFQIGAEAIGSESPVVDAEVIEMLVDYLGRLGVSGYDLLVNSVGCKQCRPAYHTALRDALALVSGTMCVDCQRRAETNPMRVLDCKIPADQPIIEKLPTLAGSLCEGCKNHFAQVQLLLNSRGIAYTVTARLVRGLDYYTRTTFEFVHGSLGAQNTLLGGGRYDGLSEDLGGPPAPGIGFSIGEDRLVLTLQDVAPKSEKDQPDALGARLPLYIAWMGEVAYRRAAEIAREIRNHGVAVEIAADSMKLKRSLEIASKIGAQRVLIIGDQELAEGRYQLKNMATGEQRSVTAEELLVIYDQPLSDPEVCAPEADKGTTP